MPTEEELLAQLAALRASKAEEPVEEQESADQIPGLKAAAVPPRVKRAAPQDRKKPQPKAAPRPAPQPKVQATSDDDYNLGFVQPSEEETDLRLPSGALCRVKLIGPENLLGSGLLDSIDSLTAIVSGDLIPKAQTGRSEVDAAALAADLGAIRSIMEKYDELMLSVVVKPTMWPKPEPDEETGRIIRVPGRAYVDTVDFRDKAYIMQFVMGGSADLETFRQESAEALAGVAAVAGEPGQAE